jgi:hypothetical protein
MEDLELNDNNVNNYRLANIEGLKWILSKLGYDVTNIENDDQFIHRQFMEKYGSELVPKPKFSELSIEEKRKFWREKNRKYTRLKVFKN